MGLKLKINCKVNYPLDRYNQSQLFVEGNLFNKEKLKRMELPIGICTCGNHKCKTKSLASLITERSELDIDKMLDSNFAKQHDLNVSLPYENLIRSINEGTSILLESATNLNNIHVLNELAIWLSYKWKVGETIRVKFLNKNPKLEELVKKATTEWMEYANVKFSYVEDGDAEIRIEFASDNSYWSQIGTSCKTITYPSQPTMHLGFSDLSIGEDVIYGTILHEFGHALGCIHEHQQTNATIKWDKKKVLDYYAKVGWDEAITNHNILDKFPDKDLSNSDYDQDSIMHYFFPSELTEDGKGSKMNFALSQKDKDFIKFCYPF